MADDQIKVDILTDTKSSVSNIVKYTAAIGGAYLAVSKVITATKIYAKAASDAEEISGKYNTVFKNMGSEASRAAKSLADNYGLADSTAQKLLSTTGDLLTGFGFSQTAALSLSEQVNSLAADLASFTNFEGGTEGAGMALTKAMLGETESAKSLGIVINQNSERYKELVKYYIEVEGKTEQQAKAYTALTIATEQSKNAIGDYARTSDSSANVIKRFGEVQKEFNEELGKMALEVGVPVISFMSDYLTKLTSVIQQQRAWQSILNNGIQGQSLEILTSGLEAAKKSLTDMEKAYNTIRQGERQATAAQVEGARKKVTDIEKEINLLNFQNDVRAKINSSWAEYDKREAEAAATKKTELENQLAAEEAYYMASLAASTAYWNAKTEEEAVWKQALLDRDDREKESLAYEAEMQQQRLAASQTFFSGWAALAELGAEKSFALAVAFKALASAEAAINSYLAYTKVMNTPGLIFPFNMIAASGVLAAGLAQQIKINSTPMPKFAQGGDFVTSGPQAIMVGDNATGRERVKVEPLGASSEGNRTLIIPITLNGRELGRAITIMSNDGRIITNSRSVR